MTYSPNAALLVIGNEILSGRTRDKNIHTLARGLFSHGVDLGEVRIVADVETAILQALDNLMPRYDYVFTTGGIGPTHDDMTSECVTKACGGEYGLHPEADAILEAYYQKRRLEYNESRKKMAYMPVDAILIPNPVSGAPGFQYRNVYVLPGIPSIMEEMFRNLLSTGRIARGATWQVCSLIVHRPESEIAGWMGGLEQQIVGLEIGSYPRLDAAGNYLVNVVMRHREAEILHAAAQDFISRLRTENIEFSDEETAASQIPTAG